MNIKRAEVQNNPNTALQLVIEADRIIESFEYEGFSFKVCPTKAVIANDKGMFKHNLFSTIYDCRYRPIVYAKNQRTTLGVAIRNITGLNVRMLSNDVSLIVDPGKDNWDTLKNVIDATPEYAFVQHTNDEILVGISSDITSFLPVYELNDNEVQKIETYIHPRPINNFSVIAKVTGNNVNGDIDLDDYTGIQDDRFRLVKENGTMYVRDINTGTEMMYGHESVSIRLGQDGINSVAEAKVFIYQRAVEYLKTMSPVTYTINAQVPFLTPGTKIKYKNIEQVINRITYEIRNIS